MSIINCHNQYGNYIQTDYVYHIQNISPLYIHVLQLMWYMYIALDYDIEYKIDGIMMVLSAVTKCKALSTGIKFIHIYLFTIHFSID